MLGVFTHHVGWEGSENVEAVSEGAGEGEEEEEEGDSEKEGKCKEVKDM